MKATEQYFPVVLFIMLCKVVLTFESVDEKAVEQYFAVVMFIMLHKQVSSFESMNLVSMFNTYHSKPWLHSCSDSFNLSCGEWNGIPATTK